MAHLDPERAVESPKRSVQELDPSLVFVVLEIRADLAAGFDLLMLIVVVTELHLQEPETRGRVLNLAFDVVTELVEIDAYPGLLAAARHPVVARVVADGEAEMAPIPDIRSAAGLVFGIDIAVEQLAALLARRGVDGAEAGDVIVGSAALESIEVQGEVTDAPVQFPATGTLVRRGIVTELGLGVGRIRHHRRDAIGHDIDDAADGPAAVEQGGRPLQDLDLPRVQRIDPDRMVRAQVRDIHGPDPAFEDAHARSP